MADIELPYIEQTCNFQLDKIMIVRLSRLRLGGQQSKRSRSALDARNVIIGPVSSTRDHCIIRLAEVWVG